MWKTWKSTVTIPKLDAKIAKSFMEMIMMVARIAEVPNRAHWVVKSEGDKYTVYAAYKEYPYVPIKKRDTIRFR